MTLGELLTVFSSADVRLHNSRDGRLVAKTKRETLKKYGSVRVIDAYPVLEAYGTSASGTCVRTYLFVYGDFNDIQKVKGT